MAKEQEQNENQEVKASEKKTSQNRSGQRSPNFPVVNLETALSKIRNIDSRNSKVTFDKKKFAEEIGYKGLSGASLGVISALKKYTLIDENSNGIFLTDTANDILFAPEGSIDKKSLLKKCALAPDIYERVIEYYKSKGSPIPTDNILQYDIVKHFNFTHQSAPTFVRVFKETLEYANIDITSLYEEMEGVDQQGEDNGGFEQNQNQNNMNTQGRQAPPPPSGNFTFPIPLANKRLAHLSFDNQFSKRDINQIREWLKFYEGTLPDEEESNEDSGDEKTSDFGSAEKRKLSL